MRCIIVVAELLFIMLWVYSAHSMRPSRPRNAFSSRLINNWLIKVNNKDYLITPAHLMLYSKNGKWTKSGHIKLFEPLKWRVPVSYVTNPTLSHYDICFAEVTGKELNYGEPIKLETEPVSKANATIVFYENKLNAKSTLPLDISMLISSPATLYNTYTTLEAEFEPTMLIKSIYDNNIQELSGALAINDNNKCIGMYVKEGPRVAPLRSPAPLPQSSPASTHQPVVILLRKSEKDYNIIQRTLRTWLGLDEYSARLHELCGSTSSSELRQLIGEKRSDINGRMATKADLYEVLNDDNILEYAYRGVFIPSTTILSILQADTKYSSSSSKGSGNSSSRNSSMTASIDVDEVIGKDSPKSYNFYYEEING